MTFPAESAETRPARPVSGVETIRGVLFIATGLAVPFFAFPPFRLWGKPVDLATVLAGLFILTSLSSLRTLAGSWLARLFAIGAVVVPLFALVPPKPTFFATRQFAISDAHWLLVVAFFLCSLTLVLGERSFRALLVANVTLAVLVAVFGFYQSYGWPRGWPAAGSMLLPFQREGFRFAVVGGHVRVSSVFLEAAWLAGYLAWVAGLALVLSRKERRQRFWIWPSAVILVAALVATLSWGGYLDFLAVLASAGIALRPSRAALRRKLAWSLAGLAVLLAFLFFSAPGRRVLAVASDRVRLLRATLLERSDLPTGMVDSTWVRYRGLQRSLDLLAERPVRGIGLGQYDLYFDDASRRLKLSNPWCGWVAIEAEMGILGAVVLMAALAIVFQRMRVLPRGSERRAAVAGCLAFALVAQLHTGSFVDLWWWYPVSIAAALSAPAAAEPIRRSDTLEVEAIP